MMRQLLHLQSIAPKHPKYFSGIDIDSRPDRNSVNLRYRLTAS
jgi:hypothetical protein